MTDRYKGFVVHLDHDIRSDDSEAIITAIKMVKGVAEISPLVSKSEDMIAYMRGRNEILKQLHDFLMELYTGKTQKEQR